MDHIWELSGALAISARKVHMLRMLKDAPYITWIIWLVLLGETIFAAATGRWSVVFVAATALALTIAPTLFVQRFRVRLPRSFLAAISLFIFGTLFLGEVYNFYEKYWWWDVMLHGGSALGFGLIGFIFVFYLFEGDRFAAPAGALAFIAFCFAMTIGALWEIFEFAMDQTFGLNMQKSGLPDTMLDLIVDGIGACLGAISGYFFLKGRDGGGPAAMIRQFIEMNRGSFRKLRNRSRRG